MTKDDFIKAGFSVVDSDNNENKLLKFLKENYPSVIKDNEINLQELKAILGLPVDEKVNGYGLNFVGRNVARAKYAQKTDKELRLNTKMSKNIDTTQNLVIKGDNLDVLKILKNYYSGKIKCIYIDPPYNTDSDEFVYPDKFDKEELEVLGLANLSDEDYERMDFSFRTKKSHNGWLSFMYPRLLLARDLLRDDGVIFISIDDNEQANLKLLCDDVFGEENFRNIIIWAYRTGGAPQKNEVFAKKHDYILFYSKSLSYTFNHLKEKIYYKKDFFGAKKDEDGNFYAEVNLRDVIEGEIELLKDGIFYKKISVKPVLNLSSERVKDFPSQKPLGLIKFLIEIVSNKDDIILDFFAGSGTTGHAVMELNKEDGGNRKFILVQIDEPIKEDKPAYQFCIENNLPPVISSITIERLRRAGEKIKKEVEEENSKAGMFEENKKPVPDIGFKVFDTVDAPKLNVDEKGQIQFPEINIDPISRIYNMIFTVGLDEPTQAPEELVKDCIYKVGNNYYITNSDKISKDDFTKVIDNASKSSGKVFIDGWTASLNATLQHFKEDVKIVF